MDSKNREFGFVKGATSRVRRLQFHLSLLSICVILISCAESNKGADSVLQEVVDLSQWRGTYRIDENSTLTIVYDSSALNIEQSLYGGIDNGNSMNAANINVDKSGKVHIDNLEAVLRNDSIIIKAHIPGMNDRVYLKMTKQEIIESNDKPFRKNVKGAQEVFVAGVENCTAIYWINGQPYPLNKGAKATNIFVTDRDIYATFQECHGNRGEWVWKNGVMSRSGGDIRSIFIDGDDVYMAGQANGSATFWKNGVATNLLTSATANSIVVDGEDIHIAITDHFNGVGKYWKNGTITSLNNCYIAKSIFLEGKDVYVAGIGWDESGGQPHVAKYWKNENEHNLSNGYKDEASANAIFVKNGTVYVAGSANSLAAYWKNDSLVYLTDGKFYSGANAIAIDNEDIYVAGYELGYGDQVGAKYWKNGAAYPLSNDINSQAFSIIVR